LEAKHTRFLPILLGVQVKVVVSMRKCEYVC